MQTLTAGDDDSGVRLDRFVRKQLGKCTLGELYRLMRTGGIRINGRTVRPDTRLRSGDRISVAGERVVHRENEESLTAELRHLATSAFFRKHFTVLFEDDALLVCDKPSSLVVHSGSGHTGHHTLIDLARAHVLATTASSSTPSLVHRLDRDTSGVIVLGKNAQVTRELTSCFRNREIRKEYLAIVHGTPARQQGIIRLALERTYAPNDGTKVRVAPQGSEAQSSYRVVGSADGVSMLSVNLHTGRTHQIRVHLSHEGHPIAGDVRYGDPEADTRLWQKSSLPTRLCLHAHTLTLSHPVSGVPLVFTAPVPELFTALVPCTIAGKRPNTLPGLTRRRAAHPYREGMVRRNRAR